MALTRDAPSSSRRRRIPPRRLPRPLPARPHLRFRRVGGLGHPGRRLPLPRSGQAASGRAKLSAPCRLGPRRGRLCLTLGPGRGRPCLTQCKQRGRPDVPAPSCTGPGSLLDGACALASALDAATLCVDFPSCRALTVHFNGGWGRGSASASFDERLCRLRSRAPTGSQRRPLTAAAPPPSPAARPPRAPGTDGCSPSVTLLKREGLSPASGFVGPGVTTLQASEAQPKVGAQPAGRLAGAASQSLPWGLGLRAVRTRRCPAQPARVHPWPRSSCRPPTHLPDQPPSQLPQPPIQPLQTVIYLYDQEGQVLLPPEAALQAAAAGAPAPALTPAPQPAPAGGTNGSSAAPAPAGPAAANGSSGAGAGGSASPGGTSWRGCFLGQAIMDGAVVETLSGVASAEECCHRCRQRQVAEGPNVTNAWNHCGAAGGCGCAQRAGGAASARAGSAACAAHPHPPVWPACSTSGATHQSPPSPPPLHPSAPPPPGVHLAAASRPASLLLPLLTWPQLPAQPAQQAARPPGAGPVCVRTAGDGALLRPAVCTPARRPTTRQHLLLLPHLPTAPPAPPRTCRPAAVAAAGRARRRLAAGAAGQRPRRRQLHGGVADCGVGAAAGGLHTAAGPRAVHARSGQLLRLAEVWSTLALGSTSGTQLDPCKACRVRCSTTVAGAAPRPPTPACASCCPRPPRRPIVQECIVPGTPEQLAQRCRRDPRCAALVLKPGGLPCQLGCVWEAAVAAALRRLCAEAKCWAAGVLAML